VADRSPVTAASSAIGSNRSRAGLGAGLAGLAGLAALTLLKKRRRARS
jgi:hypothetical protein